MRNNLIMTRAYFIAALLTVLAGCQPKENREQLKAINKNLEYSNDVIKEAGTRALREMEEKVSQPEYGDRINTWVSIMRNIDTGTTTIVDIIENLKRELLKQSDSLKVPDAGILNVIQHPAGVAYNLLENMASFKDRIPAYFNLFDSVENPNQYATLKADCKHLRKAGPLLPGYAEGLNEEQRSDYIYKWLNNNLRGSSSLMTMVVLNKLENDILYTRTMLMDHCSSKVGILDGPGSYTKYSAIAVLNSSYVRRGQTIEVRAGMGEFNNASKPRITINNHELKLDADATAVHRFKADGKPGTHILTVNIEFTKADGSPIHLYKTLKYEIANEN
jgi:hypothetical protein